MKRIVLAALGCFLLFAAPFSAVWSGVFGKNERSGAACSAEISFEEAAALFPRFRVSAKPKGEGGRLVLEMESPCEDGRILLRFKGSLFSVPREEVETSVPEFQAPREVSDLEIARAALVLAPTARTRYLVWTDLCRLTTYVLKREGDTWQVLRRLPCSAGDAAHPSPEGLFSLGVHRLSFGRKGLYSAAYALQISGNYLYHSVLLTPNGEEVLDARLGERISHGCIRHSLEDSRWLYETVPDGTAILIR
ncbi:MAG: L,D-transpeptidase [Clostridia bacterium]|nr:L,D-transpeptidase [Clostridia bacterium]